MKRPIKFRARIAKDHVENWKHGEIICGSLMVFADDPIAGCTHWIIDEKSKPYRNYPVDENSIAQLVGYDKDGNEIYEGDKVIDEKGTVWVAVLSSVMTLPQYKDFESRCLELSGLKLQEKTK